MKLAELAEKVVGVLDGEGVSEITGIAGLAEAGAGDLSFLTNPKYAALLATSRRNDGSLSSYIARTSAA